VLLFPPGYRAMRLHRSVVDFTNGFTAREKRVFAGDVFHPGPYESERTTWTFNVKVTFYRCPGTDACSNGSIPPDAYVPPGS
jgi:hypothetical protein